MSSGRCRPGSGGTGDGREGLVGVRQVKCCHMKVREDKHRFAAQHGATALAADEGGHEPGDGFVPQVAEVLERLTVEPRGALPR